MNEDRRRLARALVLVIVGLSMVTGAARADTYLHRGVETGEEVPYVVQPTGRELSTNADLTQFPPGQIDSVVAAMEENGFRTVRHYFAWSSIEPEQGHFTWDATDKIVNTLVAHQMRIVAVLNGSPNWSRTPQTVDMPDAPPVDIDNYASFVNQFVLRYGNRIEFVQLWDLPNRADHWGGEAATPDSYKPLLANGFNAARGANSETKVVLAELDPFGDGKIPGSDFTFLRGLYANASKDFFNIVAIRLDGGAYSPYDRSSRIDKLNLSRAIQFRQLMIDEGDQSKVMWASHYGWSANDSGGGVDLERQGEFIVSGIDRGLTEWPWMGLMFNWDFFPHAGTESYALLNSQGQATPALNALADYFNRGENSVAGTGFLPMDADAVSYTEPWSDQHLERRTFKTTSEVGSSATITFHGTGIIAYLRMSPQAGVIHFTIDGKSVAGYSTVDNQSELDLYNYQAIDLPFELASGLDDVIHQLTLTLVKDGQVTIGGAVVTRAAPNLWPVAVLTVTGAVLIIFAMRDLIYVIALEAGYLQRRGAVELQPPLPRIPEFRPARRA
ncbi:MAG: beta-galactosidase [Thermomicrobiales bacterium]